MKCIPAAVIAFQSDKSMYVMVPDYFPLWGVVTRLTTSVKYLEIAPRSCVPIRELAQDGCDYGLPIFVQPI